MHKSSFVKRILEDPPEDPKMRVVLTWRFISLFFLSTSQRRNLVLALSERSICRKRKILF
jgi:hypothetical protein